MASERVKYLPNNYVDYEGTEGLDRIDRIRRRFDVHSNFWTPIHERARQCDRFIAGNQWDDNILLERRNQRRPAFTFNLLPSFVRQIVNKARQDMPQVRVKPVESDYDQTPTVENEQGGTKDYSIADVYQGLLRNMEHISRAEHVYTTALTHCVHHGFGFFGLATEHNHRDPFVQDIVLRRFQNPYQVFLDPHATQADFSDGQDAFVVTKMSRDAFDVKYPKAQSSQESLGSLGTLWADWHTKDAITVATYWWIDWVDDEVVKMNDGRVHYLSDVESILDEMRETNGLYIDEDEDGELRKQVRRPVAKWQTLTATEFLSEEMESPFQAIPIFPVLGDEQLVDGITQYTSAVWDAMDAQKSYNFWRTAAMEAVAMAPKAPYRVDPRQIEGYEEDWEGANAYNRPFLRYRHIEGLPPPQRMTPPQVAAAEMSQAMRDASDVQAIIGLHDASLGRDDPSERSGRAVLARQRQGQTSTYHYIANLQRAQEAMGRCFLAAAPRVYDTRRVMRVRLPDDSDDFVTINDMVYDQESGKKVLKHDIGYGRYDVILDTGPSYATQREESVEAMLELLGTTDPEARRAIQHKVVENMAFPGAQPIAAILRKLVPDNLKSEDERAADLPKGVKFNEQGEPIWEATGEAYTPPITPEVEAMQEANRVERLKAEAEIAKAEAKKADAAAEKAKADAEMAQLQQPPAPTEANPAPGIQIEDLRAALEEALAQHDANPQAHMAMVDRILDGMADRVKTAIEARLRDANPSVSTPPQPAPRPQPPPPPPPQPEPAGPPSAINFVYDKEGRIVKAEPVYEDGDAGGGPMAFDYDDRGRITTARTVEGQPN